MNHTRKFLSLSLLFLCAPSHATSLDENTTALDKKLELDKQLFAAMDKEIGLYCEKLGSKEYYNNDNTSEGKFLQVCNKLGIETSEDLIYQLFITTEDSVLVADLNKYFPWEKKNISDTDKLQYVLATLLDSLRKISVKTWVLRSKFITNNQALAPLLWNTSTSSLIIQLCDLDLCGGYPPSEELNYGKVLGEKLSENIDYEALAKYLSSLYHICLEQHEKTFKVRNTKIDTHGLLYCEHLFIRLKNKAKRFNIKLDYNNRFNLLKNYCFLFTLKRIEKKLNKKSDYKLLVASQKFLKSPQKPLELPFLMYYDIFLKREFQPFKLPIGPFCARQANETPIKKIDSVFIQKYILQKVDGASTHYRLIRSKTAKFGMPNYTTWHKGTYGKELEKAEKVFKKDKKQQMIIKKVVSNV